MLKNWKGYLFKDREISWLSFNERVLQEAADNRTPLLERLKFLSIFSSNLDEFFRVRVASLRRMVRLKDKLLTPVQNPPQEVLNAIQQQVLILQEKFETIYEDIISSLEKENIHIIDEKQLTELQWEHIREYFDREILAHLFPVVMDDRYELPYLKDKAIYQIISLEKKDRLIPRRFAILEIPTDSLSRFYVLPKVQGIADEFVILLDDIIRANMDKIFHIFEYDEFHAYTIKLTRDSELNLDVDDLTENIMEKISRSLKKRGQGRPTRLVYDERIPDDMLQFLIKTLKIQRSALIPGGRYHNFKDFMKFPKVGGEHLYFPFQPPQNVAWINAYRRMFDAISRRDILLHHPYQSFDIVIRLLREAALDPATHSIKITLYRVAMHSNVVKSLINAVKNGVVVKVWMELQARFDEEANIYWTEKLKEAGAHVFFGIPGQKIHCKMCLIQRKEAGKMVAYGHLSTGNYNRITASLYGDHGLMTKDKRITADMAEIFNYLEDRNKLPKLRYMLLAPVNMKSAFLEKIDREILHSRAGKPAWIIAKMNSLVDPDIIIRLYEASKAGVKIKLIVRGSCSLVTGVPMLSDHIQAISILDRRLEHARVYVFGNNEKVEMFLSSADWMTRNLNFRIETAFPIFQPELRQEIFDILEFQLSDNTKARLIDLEQQNYYQQNDKPLVNAQDSTYQYLLNKHS